MAEPKKASLTVLSGPMAGTKFLLPEPPASLLVGSDLSCHFRLETSGVSPTHARISLDTTGVMIEEAGSPQGLYVNDDPVLLPTLLSSGDIVWLGSPGQTDVVMLQCVLPPRPAPEIGETVALPREVSPVEPAADVLMTVDDVHVIEEPSAPPLSPEVTDPTLLLPPEEEAGEATVIMAEPAEEVFVEPASELEETVLLPKVAEPAAPPRPPPPTEPPPPAAPPAAPAAPPAAAPRPRPSAAGAMPPVAPRHETQPLPRPPVRAERPAAAGPRAKASSPVGLYVAIGLGALVVIVGGALASWRLLLRPKAEPPAITEAKPREAAIPTPAPVAVPAATPAPLEAAAVVLPKPPAVKPIPSAAATAAPPTPPPVASAAPSPTSSPKGVTTPPPPSAEALRAQQVASRLDEAESALGARQYDQAIAHLEEALRLDPQNAKAAADRAHVIAQRDAARKTFVSGRTQVRTEKATGGGLVGFEGADVQTAAVQGRIDFEMTPASGLRPGDGYSLKFFLVNEGKKAIKIVGVTATTVVDGAGSGGALAPRVKQVEPQQRALLGEVTGAWREGTTSWSTEVLVTATKGDSLRNTLSWR